MYAYCNNNPVNFKDSTGMYMDYQDTLLSGYGGTSGIGVGGLEALLGGIAALIDGINHLIDSAKASAATRAEKSYSHDYEVHHIVAQKSLKATPARAILNEVFPDGGTNIAINKVRISTNLHKGLHTNYYYALVNCAITASYYSANGDPVQELMNVSVTLEIFNAAILVADNLWRLK